MNDDATPLIHAHLDGEVTDEQRRALADWLRQDARHVDRFVAECRLHSELFDARGGVQPSATEPPERPSVGRLPLLYEDGLTGIPPAVIISDSSPIHSFPSSLGSFLFSYGIAAVVVTVGMFIGWVCHISVYQQLANDAPRSATTPASPDPESPFVARVTGIVDCQWADAKTEAFIGARARLGRKYALASGLMEISYDTGAKVVLQGPCTYQVESSASGFLSIGRLTAQIETKGKGGRGNADKDDATNHAIGKSRMADPPSALFSIRTPTALVTDLGTEFGVEVDRSGLTRSHVFRGSVRLQAASADGKPLGPARVLHENESARVERAATAQSGGIPVVVLETLPKPLDFVRKLPKRTIKAFDLIDVVAGGDGFSGRSSRGIDPTSGRLLTEPITRGALSGDGQYYRVRELPFVDGVFIPQGGSARVQVDSAGHAASFPQTSNTAAGGIWTGKDRTGLGSNPAVLGGVDYSSPGHGVLYLHANQGITFDLEAIRRANARCRLLRFRAVAGNSETTSAGATHISADLWVLVDGQIGFERRKINGFSGPIVVSVPIADKNRFLTLVSTDAQNGIPSDWIMFGDARLEFVAPESPAAPNSPQP